MLLTDGQIAQLVEQGTENPCVRGSIPLLATSFFIHIFSAIFYFRILLAHNVCWTIVYARSSFDMFCQL